MTKKTQDGLKNAVLPKKIPLTKEQLNSIASGDEEKETRHRSDSETTEFRRLQIHRLLLRGVPAKTIAEHLGISIHTVYSDKKIIQEGMRKEVQEMDYPLHIGSSMAFYDECRNIALRIASDTSKNKNGSDKISVLAKLSALQTAIKAEDSKNNFLGKLGLYKVVNPSDAFNGMDTGKEHQHADSNDVDQFIAIATMAAQGAIELGVNEAGLNLGNIIDVGEGEDG